MIDRKAWRPPVVGVRESAGVPGALGGSRLFEQPGRAEEAAALRAFVAGGLHGIEVGFDDGRELLSRPGDERWLGLEIRRRRVAEVAARAGDACLPFRGDARTVFAALLPERCAPRVEIPFPTPALRAHHLLWTPRFVDDLARVLRSDGVLHVRTDVPAMAEAVEALLAGWRRCAPPPLPGVVSRREQVCARDGLPVWRIAARPPG